MFGKKSREWITYPGMALLVALGSVNAASAMPAVSSNISAGAVVQNEPLVQDVRWRRDRHRGRDAAIAGAAGLVGGLIIGGAIANNNNAYYNDYPPPPPPRRYRPPPADYYYGAPRERVVVERYYYETPPSRGYYRENRRPHYYSRQDERYSNY